MKDNLPNFLIVGAAKSGTTSLYHYLKQHPEVYMSPIKEPRFITSQFLKFPLGGIGGIGAEKKIIKNFFEYKRLFENVKSEKAIGEASTDNLYYYDNAIKYVKNNWGNIKIIILLRNPIESAFSAYMMNVRDGKEDLSFEDALRAEDQRINMNWPFGWHYKSVCFYYNQVKAYLEEFSQVKVYLFDDLRTNVLDLINDMYGFLGVNQLFTPDISVKYNVGGIRRNKFLHNVLTKPNLLKTISKKLFKLFLKEEKRGKLLQFLIVRNLDKQNINMKQETHEQLANLFTEDVVKLQGLINRNLMHWLYK